GAAPSIRKYPSALVAEWRTKRSRRYGCTCHRQPVGRPARRRVVSGYAGPGVEGCQMTERPKLGLIDDAVSDDPFDLAKLRVSQDFLETTNVKKLLTTVPIRKPNSQDFIRVHPSPQFRDLFAFIELRDEGEIFVANLAAVPELQTECFIAT